MPLVEIYLSEKRPPEQRRRLADALHQAIVETLGLPADDRFDEAWLARATAQTPLRRTADLQDAAQAYVMLARNESITGQVIVVDGGITVA